MPVLVYLLLLFLSCGVRLLVDSEGPRAPVPLDLAWRWLTAAEALVPTYVRWPSGLLLGALLGLGTSLLLTRWARHTVMQNLTAALAEGLSTSKPWMLTVIAILGGAAEEVFFRGVLHPWLGIPLSAFAFGAVHVRRRRGTWLWPLLSVAFALIASAGYELTGTLLTPIAMHVQVNLASQRRLGRLAAARERRPMGGLLRS